MYEDFYSSIFVVKAKPASNNNDWQNPDIKRQSPQSISSSTSDTVENRNILPPHAPSYHLNNGNAPQVN